jgi:hypothetical protein
MGESCKSACQRLIIAASALADVESSSKSNSPFNKASLTLAGNCQRKNIASGSTSQHNGVDLENRKSDAR